MRIRVGYELIYESPQPTPMVLLVNIHSERSADLIQPDVVSTDPWLPLTSYFDLFGNWCTRMVAPVGRTVITADAIVRDSGLADPVPWNAPQHEVQDLPNEVLVYLLGSRYCETDRLTPIAWQLFGHLAPGYGRVQAILDFVHERIRFDYQTARPTKTAWDAYTEREGVCRDFAHLAIAFCRCMNIPARYTTGYLGDIGVPASRDPMDFSGWLEVYLGGAWHTADARHNKPRIGRIVMARGRDATDVAITTTFGPAALVGFRVWTDEVG